ncbi:MAG TPA: 2OG-Fe(II) oxygenase [Candidatus Binatia bacterium]|nr:2OG-Fe(II) oxygenase [Candidatus Binatia bacterium]
MAMLNLAQLAAAEFHREPFEYLLVDDLLEPECKAAIVRDFPRIERSGSFPLSRLSYGPAFRQLSDELLGPDFAAAVGAKFSMDLSRYPTMLTVRGQCDNSDGQIHTDSKDKVITVLLYLNPAWESSGGRLRLLRSKNLDDYVAEVAPTMGGLIIFKRCDRSWHGHRPFEGQRMSLQMNWVKSDRYMRKERLRHEVSSFFKGLVGRKAYEG